MAPCAALATHVKKSGARSGSRYPPCVVPRLALPREVWDYTREVVSCRVDTYVTELRRKLEDDPARPTYILTVRKTGLRLRRD